MSDAPAKNDRPGAPAPAVFLDRDDTLIKNAGDLGDPAEVELVQGAAMAVASLRGLGFQVVGVTNQGGVARGKYGEADVEAVHQRIDALLERGANGAVIAGWYFCPFHPRGTVAEYTREHPDRKPAPGMLLRAAEDLRLDLPRSWMVGDTLRDTQAGEAAGCRTVLLHPDAGRLSPDRLAELAREQAVVNNPDDPDAEAAAAAHRPDFFAASLVEAVRVIASQRHTERERGGREARPLPPVPRREAGDAPAAARPASRAFRPLTLPPEEETGPLAEPPVKVTDVVDRAIKRARKAQEAEAPAEQQSRPPVEPGSEPADHRSEPAGEPMVRGSAPPEPDPAAAKALQQILHELRAGRGGGGEASAATIIACVLQSLAAVCFLGGLWMAADDDPLFQRWALATLFFQGATITALLLQRR